MEREIVIVGGSCALFCQALAAALAGEWTTRIVNDAALANRDPPDCIIVCEIGSIDELRELAMLQHAPARIAVTREPLADLLRAIVDAGFRGVLTLEASLDQLRDCIRQVADGDSYFGTDVHRVLSKVWATSQQQLTTREQQVAIMVAKGLTSRSIAAGLGVSLKTVNNHRRNIFRKLGIHDAVTLTRHAVSSGWVSLDGGAENTRLVASNHATADAAEKPVGAPRHLQIIR